MVAVAPRGGADALEVGAGAGLGHGDGGGGLARDHPGEPVGLLLLGAVGDEIVGDDVGVEGDPGGRAGIGELLVDDGVEAEVEARAAIFLRHGRAEQAGLARLGPEGAVDDPFLFPAGEVGDQLAVEEAADAVAELLVLGGEGGSAGGVEHDQSFELKRGAGAGWVTPDMLRKVPRERVVGMAGRLGEREDRGETGVAMLEDVAPMLPVVAAEGGGQLVAKARIVLAALQAHPVLQDREEFGLERSHRHPKAVGALIDVVIGPPGVEQIDPALVLPHPRRLQRPGQSRKQRRPVHHRAVDHLALAGAARGEDTGQHPEGEKHPAAAEIARRR